jgi:hypothetical protein
MTSLSLTSGQIQDIISALEEKENALYLAENYQLSAYYMNLGVQFQKVYDKLQEVAGEKRVAKLVLAAND